MVSNWGRVKRVNHVSPAGKPLDYMMMKLCVHDTGYHVIYLGGGKEKVKLFLHRLVAIHFIDNPEDKEQVNHLDKVRTNNTIENLEWTTVAENAHHRDNYDPDAPF